MRGKNMIALVLSFKTLKQALLALMVLAAIALPSTLRANDLPLAAGSPLTGVSFDDRPLLLPVQRNFQMAMLTASSQIGRSCGRMESYGWRTAQSEQHRVNLIFSNTVDRLRALGYAVEAQTPSSVSKDITLYTADRPDKHFLFMWSAGEIGLVMVLCESSPPLTGRMAELYNATPAQAAAPPPEDVVQSRLEAPAPTKGRRTYDAESFTPYGDWVGNYTCMRGYTGATMHIDAFKGEDFQGTFRFYPTAKNTTVPRGSYAIYGQYDRQSRRILINPGKWIDHPNGYYKTIIIGSFDAETRSFSGFFQGILGCTSFEAKNDSRSPEIAASKPRVKAKKKSVKKTTVKKPVPKNPTTPDEVIAPIPENVPPVSGDIDLPANGKNSSAPSPASAATTTVVPPSAAPAATAPSSSQAQPVPLPPGVAPTSALPPSSGSSVTPSPASSSDIPASVPPLSLPSAPEPPKPTSSLAPKAGPHAMMLASSGPPLLAPVQSYNVTVPTVSPVQHYQTQTPVLQATEAYNSDTQRLQEASRYDENLSTIRPADSYNTTPTTINAAESYSSQLRTLEQTQPMNNNLQELPKVQEYQIFKPPGS